MATFRLDFEEWHELYLAAVAVPEEERRPCLQTAILGLAAVLSECNQANPNETALVLSEGMHHCEKAECQKALETAVAALATGVDPFDASARDDDVIAEIRERLSGIEDGIDRLLEEKPS